MIRLTLLFALLAPASAAQTLRPAELPGAVVRATRLAEAVDGALGRQLAGGEFVTDPFDQTRTLDDSLRVRLRDVPAARLRRILAHLDGAAHRALHAHVLARRRAFATPEGRAEARTRLRDPGRLADADLARRYHAATASEAMVRTTAETLYRRAFAAVPELRDVMAPDGGLDAVLAEHDAASAAAFRREASILRVALAELDPAVVEAHIAFAESPDGRAFGALARDAVAAALALDHAEALIDRIWGPAPPPGAVARVPSAEAVVDHRPDPALDVYDAVYRPPMLIGGLDALQRTVRYPRLARETGLSGRVIVEVIVEKDGTVSEPVVTYSPSDLLSQAAVDAVWESRFEPGLLRTGRRARVRYAVPVDFAP